MIGTSNGEPKNGNPGSGDTKAMPLTRIHKTFLLVPDENLANRIRLKRMLGGNDFDKIPEIKDCVVLPAIDCILIESELPTSLLAEQLRQLFKGALFILTPVAELDGVLPQEAWNFINARRAEQ